MPKSRKSTLDPEMRTHKKNLDNIKLLVSYAPFQDEVRRIRDYLRIPEGGFATDKAIATWTHATDERSDEMADSPGVRRQMAAISTRLRNGGINRRQANLAAKIVYHAIPWNYITEEVDFLITKFGIPENYKDHVRTYIMTGRVTAPVHNFVITLSLLRPISEGRKRQIGVEIYARQTNQEFQEMKRELNKWGRELPRFQSLRDVEEKLTIEQWFRDRMKHDPVENSDYRMTAKEIAQNLLGNAKHTQKVYDVPRDLTSLRRRRFGKQ